MIRRLLLVLPLLVLVSLFVFTGFRGVDLGEHWDEVPWHIEHARTMVKSGLFLPRSYIYPSLSKFLVILPTLPTAIETFFATRGDPVPVHAAMREIAESSDYLLTARRVFIVISSLSMVWIYGAVLAMRGKVWEAIVAASCLGLSWEFAYHSRWVANDCILTQFAALMLFMLALFRRRGEPRFLYFAAAAVGLGMGAKQPGVFLLLPVLLTSVLSLPLRRPWAQLSRLFLICAVTGLVFIATTPGVVLDPFVFLTDARNISSIYGAGHGRFTATGPLQHVTWVLTYLAVDFFSPYHLVSFAMSACVVFGIVVWFERDWRFAASLLVFPIGFLLFFCSKYVVMIARNYLQVTPFLALLAARGLAEIFARLRRYRYGRWAQRLLAAVLVGVAALQALFLIRAAESIRHYDPAVYVREALSYVAAHPKEQYRVSKKVRALAASEHLEMPANVTRGPGGQAVVMFGRAEMGDPSDYKENDPWLTDAVFGPREVNFNWYAVWGGKDRIVVMPIEKARDGKVPLAR